MASHRTNAWKPWIKRFGLNPKLVLRRSAIYTLEFAEQLGRCASDVERKLLLGIKEEV